MPDLQSPWLVVAAHSNSAVATKLDSGPESGLQVVRFRRRTGRPLTGDQVRLDEAMTVREILPRRNRFGRGIWGGRFREIAANLDRILIMVAAEPVPSRDLLHRYVAAAGILDIPCSLVLNKTDLDVGKLDADLEIFQSLGHRVFRVCANTGAGVDELAAGIGDQTSLLVGQSGVGKTSLANRLIPDLKAQTSALSRVTGKGTHTTTTCRLHRLPDGGWMGDTPGVWEFSLWAMDAIELEEGFSEFRPISVHCRFRDCRHLDEPGCAIRQGVEAGTISDYRYQAWRRLLAEVEKQGAA